MIPRETLLRRLVHSLSQSVDLQLEVANFALHRLIARVFRRPNPLSILKLFLCGCESHLELFDFDFDLFSFFGLSMDGR